MWGQNWGQMIWGQAAAAVPAIGFWGVLLLGAVLGAVGVRLLRGTKPRTLGALALALAILIPLSARAITLITFTNGTVADANQVNGNFAALTPVSGFNEMNNNAVVGSQTDVFAPSFVAPRAMTCTVNIENTMSASASPVGTAIVRAVMNQNGVISFANAPPQNGVFSAGFALTAIGGNTWQATQTRQFSVSAGATVSFGGRVIASGDFTASNGVLELVIYNCI